MPEGTTDRRRTFVPVVAAGLGAGALAAVAANQAWARGYDPAADGHPPLPIAAEAGESPLAATLSLVVLACWGVVLVTRGVVRRAVAGLAVLAAAGLLATAAAGFTGLQDQVLQAMLEAGATGDTLATELTAWYWVGLGSAVVLVLAAALAVAWCPAWPEMGARYDAPGSPAATRDDVAPGERSNLDLWKQLDEGRDPTA